MKEEQIEKQKREKKEYYELKKQKIMDIQIQNKQYQTELNEKMKNRFK